MYKGIVVGPQVAQNKIAFSQLPNHQPCHFAGLVNVNRLQILRQNGFQVLGANNIPCQPCFPRLHVKGHLSQHRLLIPIVNRHRVEPLLDQVALYIPLVQQHPRRLVIQLWPIPRQLLVAVQNRHHRQQQRVPGQLANRLRVANGFVQAITLAYLVGPLGKGLVVPALNKVGNLVIGQVLQHVVLKPRIPKGLRLVAQPAGGRHHLHLGVVIGKAVNIRHHHLPQVGIKHLINAVKQGNGIPRLQHLIQPQLVEAAGNIALVQILHQAAAFVLVAVSGILAQLNQQGQGPLGQLLQIAHGLLGPLQGNVLQEGRLTRSRIA